MRDSDVLLPSSEVLFQEIMPLEKTAADFFAGIGLASAGLIKQKWQVKYALDCSETKQRMYESHFGSGHYHQKDIKDIVGHKLPKVTLAHASFPCTDTSVAGSRGGIDSGESSAFWQFVRVLAEMGRPDGPGKPPFVLVENVEGLLTSGEGRDLESALKALNKEGYATDMLLIDASHFVPQSRVRLFLIGALHFVGQQREQLDKHLAKSSTARRQKICTFISSHPNISWFLRDLPNLPPLTITLEEIIDANAEWWPRERTEYLFSQMFDRHQDEVRRLSRNENWSYRTVFRRMRSRNGSKQSTAELRTDGIAGCLRTPKGGSARQIILRAGNGRFDARLLNAKENARLMGAGDFVIDKDLSLNDALFGFGDAVCVPVIEWIAENYLNPLTNEYAEVLQSLQTSAVGA
jgi:DNA (cytosine-5)-methyltransferase 1